MEYESREDMESPEIKNKLKNKINEIMTIKDLQQSLEKTEAKLHLKNQELSEIHNKLEKERKANLKLEIYWEDKALENTKLKSQITKRTNEIEACKTDISNKEKSILQLNEKIQLINEDNKKLTKEIIKNKDTFLETKIKVLQEK